MAPKNISIELEHSYQALCRAHLTRILHDEVKLEAVTENIDLMARHTLNGGPAENLETLSELVEAYEPADHGTLPALPSHEFLPAHRENIGMSAAEWDKRLGIDRSTASRLLRGERKFNTSRIRKTASDRSEIAE